MGFMILNHDDNDRPLQQPPLQGRERLLLILKTLGHLIDKADPIRDRDGKLTGFRVPVRELNRLRAMTREGAL